MGRDVLDIKDLSISFSTGAGEVEAVKNISFSVKNGEALGILGESGSGKSVSALSILGLVPPPGKITSGYIKFYDENLIEFSEAKMRQLRGSEISMVFQDPLSAFNPVYTIGQQLLHVIQTHKYKSIKMATDRALEVLNLVGLPDPKRVMTSYPHQLSGGMRQRALIGMALACEPKLLIADEPTTALDVTIQAQIVQLFHDLRRELDLTLIYITHNLDLMSELCDRAIVMNKGQIVERGDVVNLFNSPKHDYTKMLLDCVPRLDDSVARLSKYKKRPQNLLRKKSEFLEKRINSEIPLIEFSDVSKEFDLEGGFLGKIFNKTKKLKAVNEFNLKIFQGDIVGIVGESGSGKSTVAMLALLLLEASSGQMHYKGKSVVDFVDRDLNSFRTNVQIVFQDSQSALNPRKTVFKTLKEALIIRYGVKDDIYNRARELLVSMGLETDIFDRFPHSLSGGQRQRVGIARAMAMEPKLIVADEPVSSLDVSLQSQIINLFQTLHKKHNLTLMFISHDLALVSHLCTRLVVMQNGSIVEAGNTSEIMTNPNHPYTRNLISAVPKGLAK